MNHRDYEIDQVLNTRVSGVSESLHKLADQFDQYTTNHDSIRLKAMSVELQQIAWSSLFVSTTIEKLVSVMSANDCEPNGYDHSMILRQIDSLHVAVKYLSHGVQSAKPKQSCQSDQGQTIDEALEQLAQKLQGVADECRYFRK